MKSTVIKKDWFYILTIIYVSIVLSGIFSGLSDDKVYVVTAVYLLFFFFWLISGNNIRFNKKAAIIPLIFIALWMYGVILGLFRENTPEFIARNFAGMSCYILFFSFSTANVTLDRFKKILLFFSRLSIVFSFFTWFFGTWLNVEYIIKKIPVLNAYDGGVVSWHYTNIQYYNRELIYVAYSIALYELINNKISHKQWGNLLIIALASFYECYLNISDGDLLAIIALTFLILIVNLKKTNFRKILFVILLLFAYILISVKNGSTPIEMIFSTQDGGNSLRMQEFHYIINNMNFWGYGLGAKLFFPWRNSFDYGTELIFLNIFHKFGFFAIVLVISYLITFIKSLHFMISCEGEESVIPMSLMGYLFPSLANPMLFGVIPVVCHCMTLIFLEENYRNR